ncbi:MAG: hypothetical protein V3R64_00610 [Sphingomonadales bacterium]
MGVPIKALFAAFIFLFFALFSSLALAQDVPEDFEVVFTSSPALVSQDIEIESLKINANGEVVLSPKVWYAGQIPDYTREELPEMTLQLNPEALAGILKAINENEFFTLDANYNDPNIMDGDWAELTITAGGQTRTVRTRNIKVNAFDRITIAINGQLPVERRLKYNAINGADYEEVER